MKATYECETCGKVSQKRHEIDHCEFSHENDIPNPCPFCGGNEINHGDFRSVVCRTCGCQGPWLAVQQEDSVKAWNRRIILPPGDLT